MQKKQISYETALKKAMSLCSKAEKCKSDIYKKLYDWKVDISFHSKIIEQLEEMQFIDEERFTGFYVRDKIKFNKWGKIKIKSMLLQKKISEKNINRHLLEISEIEYHQNLSEILKHKNKHLKEDDKYKRKQKLLKFAIGRGFEPNLIFNIIKNQI